MKILRVLTWPYRRYHRWRYQRACLDFFYYKGLLSYQTLEHPLALFRARAELLRAEHAVEYHAAKAGVTA